MNLRNPLPGYEPGSLPMVISTDHAELVATFLQDAGYVPAGSCKTIEQATVAQMTQYLEGHSRRTVQTDELIGPLVLQGVLQTGNVIGLWKQKPAG